MNTEELLRLISKQQLEYLSKFVNRTNTQTEEGGKRYTTSDLSTDDATLPADTPAGCCYLVLKPDEHLKKVGMLSILFGERLPDDSWVYAYVLDGKPCPKPIDPARILIAIPAKHSWDQRDWIPKEASDEVKPGESVRDDLKTEEATR